MSVARPVVSLLVLDLDNTVWDWFGAWHASFAPMLLRLAQRSGIPQPDLEREIRAIHQRVGTSEYTPLLQELPSLRRLHGPETDLLAEYDDVVHVLNRGRKMHTRVYAGVVETLQHIRGRGVPIVAYTESIAYWTEWRIRHVGLDGLLDVLYSSPDHDWPEGLSAQDLRTRPAEDYGLKLTAHRHVAPGVLKPNVEVLRTILKNYKTDPRAAVYVGDSLTKDITMAQQAGLHDVHARYGVSDARPEYDLLRRVSHWSGAAIAAEKIAAAGSTVTPSYAVDRFADLAGLFDFQPKTDLM